MKNFIRTFLIIFFFVPPTFAQLLSPKAASQAQVNAGTSKTTFVSPFTLNHWPGGGGGPTNGQTAAQVGALIEKTNDAFAGVIGTNGTPGTYKFSTSGTNAVSNIATNLPGWGTGSGGNATGLTNGAIVTSTNYNKLYFTGGGGGAYVEQSFGGHKVLTIENGASSTTGETVIPGQVSVGRISGDGSALTGISGSQTPIAQDVNYAGYSATNMGSLVVTGAVSAGSISTSTFNVNALYATNFYTVTNALLNPTIDFSKSEWRATIGTNITLGPFANVTSGVMNEAIIALQATASITVTVSGSRPGSTFTGTLTNGQEGDYLFRLQPGVKTNHFELIVNP